MKNLRKLLLALINGFEVRNQVKRIMEDVDANIESGQYAKAKNKIAFIRRLIAHNPRIANTSLKMRITEAEQKMSAR